MGSAHYRGYKKRDLAIVILYNRQDIDPTYPEKPQFTSQILGNVIRLLSGKDAQPLQP